MVDNGEFSVKNPIAPRPHTVMGKVGRRSIASSTVEGHGVKNLIAPRPHTVMVKAVRRSIASSMVEGHGVKNPIGYPLGRTR